MWLVSWSGCLIGVTLSGSTDDSGTFPSSTDSVDSADSADSVDSATTDPIPETTCGDSVRDHGEICLLETWNIPLYDRQPWKVAIADWDGTGLGVVIGSDAELGYLPADFGAVTWQAPFSGRVTALAVGAFDLSAALDLVVGTSTQSPVILLGDGAGGTLAQQPTVGAVGTRDVAVGDLRHSGILGDVGVGGSSGGGVLQAIDGTATVSWASPVDSAYVALAQTSPDRTSFVAASGTTLRTVPLATDLDGPITAGIEASWTLPSAAVDVIAADTDADGDEDVYVLLEDARLLQLVSDGVDGWVDVSGAPWTELDLGSTSTPTAGILELPGGLDLSLPPFELEAADMDGDGSVDLVAVAPYRLIWLLNDGAASFTRQDTSGSVPAVVRLADVALGDLDADGDLDVVVGVETSTISVLWSTP